MNFGLSQLFGRIRNRKKPDTTIIDTVSLIDKYSSYPSEGLNPRRLTSILKEADVGNITRLSELCQEATTKDAYEIVSASEDDRDKQIRDFIAQRIENIKGFNASIGDLLDAVPRGLSVCQIVWAIDNKGDVAVDRLEHTVQKNFRYGKASDPKSDLGLLRRITDENLSDGVELEQNKWIVHEVKATSGYATQVQLMRTILWMYLFRNFGWKAFVVYCEVYGMPLRLGKYPSGTIDERALNELRTAVRSLGTDASGIFPDNMMIEIVEAAKSGSTENVHTRLIELASKSYAKAILGHTGTSESTPGKLGGEDAAREAKFDLVSADAEALAYTISDQLITPWVNFQFGTQESYPYFKFIIVKPEDLEKTIRVLQIAQQMGKEIPANWFGQKFGIPDPTDKEEVLQPREPATLPFGSSLAKGLLGTKLDLLR